MFLAIWPGRNAAHAIVFDTSGLNGVPAEPAKHHSFVTDWLGQIVATDSQYMDDVRNNFPGRSIDIVMQQCYGGGFANDAAATLGNYTFASASRWDQVSWSTYDPGVFVSTVENFTRAWRANASINNVNYSMWRNFQVAIGGNPNTDPEIPKDEYAISADVDQQYYEYPQYDSPDAFVTGPNDSRDLYEQYAIIVEWSTSNGIADRYTAIGNIARIYNTLRTGYQIPTGHIVVLQDYGAGTSPPRYLHDGTIQDSWPDDTADDQYVNVNDSNERANWLSALRGNYFTDAQGNTQRPGANDRLFIYNTGHGGHGQFNAAIRTPGNPRGWEVLPGSGAENWVGTGSSATDPEMAAIVNEDGTVHVQVATLEPLLGPLDVVVNGWSGVLSLLSSGMALDLGFFGPLDDPSLHFYGVDVPYDSAHGFSADGRFTAEIEIPLLENPDSVWAFTFAGGTFQYIATTVPEPATGTLLLVGCCIMRYCRRWKAQCG
jgi:hypothetical protein